MLALVLKNSENFHYLKKHLWRSIFRTGDLTWFKQNTDRFLQKQVL